MIVQLIDFTISEREKFRLLHSSRRLLQIMRETGHKRLHPIGNFLVAGISASAARAVVHPYSVIKIVGEVGAPGGKTGLLGGAYWLIRSQGWRALGKGLTPSVIRAFPHVGIQFTVFDAIKKYLPDSKRRLPISIGKASSYVPIYFAGGIAASVATLITHPLDVVKVRLIAVPFKSQQYHGWVDGLEKILAQEGVARGLYRGLLPSLVGKFAESRIAFFHFYKRHFFRRFRLRWCRIHVLGHGRSSTIAYSSKRETIHTFRMVHRTLRGFDRCNGRQSSFRRDSSKSYGKRIRFFLSFLRSLAVFRSRHKVHIFLKAATSTYNSRTWPKCYSISTSTGDCPDLRTDWSRIVLRYVFDLFSLVMGPGQRLLAHLASGVELTYTFLTRGQTCVITPQGVWRPFFDGGMYRDPGFLGLGAHPNHEV